MLVVPNHWFDCYRLLISSLSQGTSGTPRQVMTGAPNRLIVTGGTPRHVHSRSKAAIAFGWATKNAGFFQTRASKLVQIVGRRGPVARADPHRRLNRMDQSELLGC